MEKNKLNSILENAKKGCADSIATLSVQFSPCIQKAVDRSWYKLPDPIAFEEYCYQLIANAIKKYEPNKCNFEKFINITVSRAERKYIKRKETSKNKKEIVHLDEQHSDGDLKLEIIDTLASVEDSILVKEKITALARGDDRRYSILSHWTDGLNNDSEIATLLAQRFGGNAKSHRIFIQRFRTECQQTLSQVS